MDHDRNRDYRSGYARSDWNGDRVEFIVKRIVSRFLLPLIRMLTARQFQHSALGWCDNYNSRYDDIPLTRSIWTKKVGNIFLLSDRGYGNHVWN